MPDLPSRTLPPFALHTYGRYGPEGLYPLIANSQASVAWPAANLAMFIPISIPFYFPVKRMMWGNGSVVGGNKDVGIYTVDGVRLYSSGSTAEGTASGNQYVSPATPFVLSPGRYYFALCCDGTTNHMWGMTVVGTNEGRIGGLLQQQLSSVTLPAQATFAQWASSGYALIAATRW